MEEKTIPKFKVGQVVIMASIKSQNPFRIKEMMWDDGWWYAWNRRDFASESMIRCLTPEEVG